MKNIDWSDLQYFFAVAETGTLERAAKQTGVSQATIWRRIRALQQSLGISLFNDQRSGHVLSPAGLEVMVAAESMESDVIDLLRNLAPGKVELKGEVRITAPEFVGSCLIAPNLTSLLREHPRLRIELLLGSPTSSLLDRQTDIALLFEQVSPVRFNLHSSVHIPFGVYASQAYINKYGLLAAAEELIQHQLVDFEEFSVHPHTAPHIWLEKTKAKKAKVTFRSNSPYARAAAVASGVGIGVFPVCLAKQWTQLKCILGPADIGGINLLVLISNSMAKDSRVRAAITFLESVLSKHVASG